MSIVNVAILPYIEAYVMSGVAVTGHSNSLSDPTSTDDVLITMLLPRGSKRRDTMLAHVAASAMKDMNSIIVCLYELRCHTE